MSQKAKSKSFSFIKHEDVYIVLLKYFDGDPLLLNKTVVKDLENFKYKGEMIKKHIEPSIIKHLKNIISAQKKYEMTYKYPEWEDDKEEVQKKLDEMFP